jgi:hypothetical protein
MRQKASFALINSIRFGLIVCVMARLSAVQNQVQPPRSILNPEEFRHFFIQFSQDEKSMVGDDDPFPWAWFERNVPLLDVPDKEIEETYYFRWYAFQKRIKLTPDGYVIDEFVDNVPWAGKFNTISAAAEHHIREARWLRDPEYALDYTNFWFAPDGEPRRYSFAAADAVYQLYLATGNKHFAIGLLPKLQNNFSEWENTHRDRNGLYWQIDDRDGMEFSIGGSGYRPTINSYMYGDAKAIARIAELAGQAHTMQDYEEKADRLRRLIETRLWSPRDSFYETVPRNGKETWSGVRELVGFVPWYFNIPNREHAIAWRQLFDPEGFAGRFGPTTAERRNPRFGFKNPHECLWNGPSWPFATTQTLVALANIIDNDDQAVMSASDYFRLMTEYTYSQRIRAPNGRIIPWIDEDLDADTGEWIARGVLISKNQPPANRGRYYNHSGYADLIITGLVGVRPSPGNELVVRPLIPPDRWNYFALDKLPYHGHLLAIVYDRSGRHYHFKPGLTVLCDGRVIGHDKLLRPITVSIPQTTNR